MKLYISNTGIKDSVSTPYEDGKRELENARALRLNTPSSFSYNSYISDLKNKVKEYSKELSYINNALIKSENKYNNLFDDEANKIDHMNQFKLSERAGVKDVL